MSFWRLSALGPTLFAIPNTPLLRIHHQREMIRSGHSNVPHTVFSIAKTTGEVLKAIQLDEINELPDECGKCGLIIDESGVLLQCPCGCYCCTWCYSLRWKHCYECCVALYPMRERMCSMVCKPCKMPRVLFLIVESGFL